MEWQTIRGFIITTLLGSATSAGAAILAGDSFLTGSDPTKGEYTVGNIRPQEPTAYGFNGPWSSPEGTGTYNIQAAGLDYASAAYEAGGSVRHLNTGDTFRSVVRSLNPQTYADGNAVYFSALMSISESSAVETDGSSLVQFIDTNTSGFGLAFGFNAGAVVVRYRNTASATTFSTLQGSFAANTPYLFMAKLVLNTDTFRDDLSVWLNPASVASEAAAGTPTLGPFQVAAMTSGANGSLENVTFTGGNLANTAVTIDEIRLGSAFEDVVAPAPVPEPGMMAMTGLVALGLLRRRRKA